MLLALQLGLAFVLGGMGGFFLGRWRRPIASADIRSKHLAPNQGPPSGPLGFLERCEPRAVARVLAQVPLTDAAGVLGVLNPGYADQVLQHMSERQQEDIITTLLHQPELSDARQAALAASLRKKLSFA